VPFDLRIDEDADERLELQIVAPLPLAIGNTRERGVLVSVSPQISPQKQWLANFSKCVFSATSALTM
jgi:hypothetical protein